MILDLKNGVFDLGGYPLTKDTTIDDIPEIEKYNVKVMTSKCRPDFFTIRSLDTITFDNVEAMVCVNLKKNQKAPRIIIEPVPDLNSSGSNSAIESCMWALGQSKKWLKAALPDIEPATEHNLSIWYNFKWGKIYAQCVKDRDYDIAGGEIKVNFK